jgi:glutathione synthase/RimK-type ligase-like ATP-grasp enzyme
VTTRDLVLILTHASDHYTVDLVAEAVRERGGRAIRVDTDLFPSELPLAAALPSRSGSHRVRIGDDSVELARVRSVWARRLWPAKLDPDLDPSFREACVRESAAALDGFLDALDGVPWINPPAATVRAENKLRQLRIATEVGLEVPETLLTNDPEQARRFFERHEGRVVVKLLRPLASSMERAHTFVRTSELRETDLEHLDGLRHAPMVFQERVEKACELRVVCVGERQLCAAIDASGSAGGTVDWRAAERGEASWKPAELPVPERDRLDALRRGLGLVYGAADVIRTPDGRHVFLEINSGGEWGMLQRDAGLDVASALAEHLTKETA